jgi:uncharacterized membrane protein
MVNLPELLKWTGWLVLAVLAVVLMFTRLIIEWLGMENTLQSVLMITLPLVVVAAIIEWMTRHLKNSGSAK